MEAEHMIDQDRLEPEAMRASPHLELGVLTSMAMSLKRIADTLERWEKSRIEITGEPSGLVEINVADTVAPEPSSLGLDAFEGAMARLPAIPEPPWSIGGGNNAKRAGWAAYFIGMARDSCPFPPARGDLKAGFEEGWDAAKTAAEVF